MGKFSVKVTVEKDMLQILWDIKQDKMQEDMGVPNDARVASIIQQIANKICPFIKVTVDCPSKHASGYMPILDIEVAVKNNKILHRFIRKSMVNFLVLQEASAMPFRMKMVCLKQEVVRTLRNNCTSEDESVKNYFLSEFSLRLQVSAYPVGFRQAVIEAGMQTYDQQLERDKQGVCPLYRPKGYKESERRIKKEVRKFHGGDQMMLSSSVPQALDLC